MTDNDDLTITISLPDDVTYEADDHAVTINGPEGTITKQLTDKRLNGTIDPWTYTMKICSGHFPMQVQVQGDELVIENFIGESVPRRVDIPSDVDLNVDGDEITLTSLDKERAGQTAGRIENICKRSGFDERIFQDGIYITEKPDKLSQKR